MIALNLRVPGLRGAGLAGRPRAGFPQPIAPALAWLLARAQRIPDAADLDQQLFQASGLSPDPKADLPVAALTRLADGGAPDQGWWLRADPVHLRPDLNGVFLADAGQLAITADEAAALTAAFNQQFASTGLDLRLEALHPQRWYLRLAAAPALRTWPLLQAVGRDIRALLPYGPDKGRWHALLTEAQMLFHSHPINQARDQRRQPLINGLWLWGGGTLPQAASLRPAAALALWWADEPLACGLAHWTNQPVRPLPANATAWRATVASSVQTAGVACHQVVLDATLYDPVEDQPLAWVEHVEQLERDWFVPCQQLLQAGQLQTLTLYPGDGWRYHLTPAARWRVWRRPQPLIEVPPR